MPKAPKAAAPPPEEEDDFDDPSDEEEVRIYLDFGLRRATSRTYDLINRSNFPFILARTRNTWDYWDRLNLIGKRRRV